MASLRGESLRIGIICHTGLGGSVRVAVGLAAALAARGHAIHVLARTVPLGARNVAPGVSFHGLRGTREPLSPHLQAQWSRTDLESFRDLILSVVGSTGLDVLHFHYGVPFAEVAAQVGHRLGPACPRLLMTLHGTDVSTFGDDPGLGPAVRQSLDGLDAVTTVSNAHARLSAQVFGLNPFPHVIPNFVDLRKFRPRPTIPFPRRTSFVRRPRVAHVSNFRQVKDPESMARVFVRVRNEIDTDLWLVGDGDGMSSVRSILRGAGALSHVRFFGLRREIHRILRRTHVLLLTSRRESFCLAALEAAACGVPVVAPRVGGLPEVIVDGETGLLFEAGNEEKAARAVLRLLADVDLRSAMGGAAVERARLFSIEAIVSRYERLYRDVLDGGAASSERSVGGLLIGAGA